MFLASVVPNTRYSMLFHSNAKLVERIKLTVLQRDRAIEVREEDELWIRLQIRELRHLRSHGCGSLIYGLYLYLNEKRKEKGVKSRNSCKEQDVYYAPSVNVCAVKKMCSSHIHSINSCPHSLNF